jgi:hypothetical protein
MLGWPATICSMTLPETQQRRMLELLRRAGRQPVTLEQLRAGGIHFPAVVLSELELRGHAIKRVQEDGRLLGVRLLAPREPDRGGNRRRRRWFWPTR